MATTFIKRKANTLTAGWDNKIEDTSLNCMIAETIARVCEADPEGGNWCVDGHKMNVWVDNFVYLNFMVYQPL